MKTWILTGLILSVAFSGEALPGMPSSLPSSSQKAPAPPPAPTGPIQPLIKPHLIIPPSERTLKPTGDLFAYPGVVTLKDDHWVGSDNFLNISHSMAIQVNLVKPETLELTISKEELRNKVETLFGAQNLSVLEMGREGKPPLPMFNMLVMIFPIEGGYCAACVGRLFEDVNLSRVRLKPGEIFQAITWTQANLVVAPKEQFEKLLIGTVESLTTNFIRRVKHQEVDKKPEPEQLSPEDLK
jgi:hypothetical protein